MPEPGRSCLFLAPVWPEPGSSAAGVRTLGLIKAFQRWGYTVGFGAGARPNAYTAELEELGVQVFQVRINHEAELAAALASTSPTIVIFDRFFAEEAFSFRVRELSPTSLRLLDMQDLHALRRGRQRLVKSGAAPSDVIMHVPSVTHEELARELAAVQRSDLVFVCSPTELALLQYEYRVPVDKLALASFFCTEASEEGDCVAGEEGCTSGQSGYGYDASHGWEAREGFVTMGGFMHQPNMDGVRWLASTIWPLIRKQLPGVEMHIYGAYPTQEALQLNRPNEGCFVHGFTKSLDVLASRRVLLAPLRFGAGIKGKIVDGWRYGLPAVTTSVGAEGMSDHQDAPDALWGGLLADDPQGFADAAVRLYTDNVLWEGARAEGRRLLRSLYGAEENLAIIRSAVDTALSQLDERRERDVVGAMLWQQTSRATEYFSRWIELKEANTAAGLSELNRMSPRESRNVSWPPGGDLEADAASCVGSRRRMGTLIAGAREAHAMQGVDAAAENAEEQAWHLKWQRRLECWFVALPLPTQTQLGSCFGALSLHLASRFETAWRNAQAPLGGVGQVAEGTLPQGATVAAEPGCEWLEDLRRLQLPDFPELTGVPFTLPPLPRLLPKSGPDALLSLRENFDPEQAVLPTASVLSTEGEPPRGTAGASSVAPVSVLGLAGAAGGAGAALLSMWCWWRCRDTLRVRRPNLRSRPFNVEPRIRVGGI
jgi:hypothetical protein